MIMMIMIFLLFGLIKHGSSIQCYTCNEEGFHCPLPLNLDGGDESNENDIEAFNYDPDYACLSDYSLNPRTGEEKLILRGSKHCREVNIPNRRIHCCYTNHCNKQVPSMMVRTFADSMPTKTSTVSSNQQRYVSSIILITFNIIFQYFY